MGTTGFAAQAHGAGEEKELGATLLRPLLLGAGLGGLIVVLQAPLAGLALHLLDPGAEVARLARSYIDIRIWGAPATLMLYAILGWQLGIQRAASVLLLQLVLNGTNMALTLLLVVGLDWRIEGAATGTLVGRVPGTGAGPLAGPPVPRSPGGTHRLAAGPRPGAAAGAGPRQCRHLHTHRLLAARLRIVRAERCTVRRRHPGRQCGAAAVPGLSRLRSGRLRSCRRGAGRQRRRSEEPQGLPQRGDRLQRLGLGAGSALHAGLRPGRTLADRSLHRHLRGTGGRRSHAALDPGLAADLGLVVSARRHLHRCDENRSHAQRHDRLVAFLHRRRAVIDARPSATTVSGPRC